MPQWQSYIDWLKRKNASPTTLTDYTQTFRRFFSSYNELTPANVKAFIDAPLAPSTRNKYRNQLVGLSDFLRLPIEWKFELPQIKHGIEAPLVFSEEHEEMIRRYMTTTDFGWMQQGRFYSDVLRLLILTGLRVSEAKYLKPEDFIDSETPHLLVRKANGRSHSKDGRIVPLSIEAVDILRSYSLPLRFSQKTLTRLLHDARVKFDLPHYTAHVARKSWATRALRRGVPVTAVCAAGGWESATTLLRYAGRSAETLHQAFN